MTPLETAREALRFYADEDSYVPEIVRHTTTCSFGDTPALEDSGDLARSALAALESEVSTDLHEENRKLREALKDLMSWFPENPSAPEWRLPGGGQGADDAVQAARDLCKDDDEGEDE